MHQKVRHSVDRMLGETTSEQKTLCRLHKFLFIALVLGYLDNIGSDCSLISTPDEVEVEFEASAAEFLRLEVDMADMVQVEGHVAGLLHLEIHMAGRVHVRAHAAELLHLAAEMVGRVHAEDSADGLPGLEVHMAGKMFAEAPASDAGGDLPLPFH